MRNELQKDQKRSRQRRQTKPLSEEKRIQTNLEIRHFLIKIIL